MYYNSLSLDVLQHSGILGMKWGIRRYQNEDGSLTEEGRRHYGYLEKRDKIRAKDREEKRRYSDARDERRSNERMNKMELDKIREQETSKKLISNNELRIEKMRSKQKKLANKYDLKIEKERGKQILKEMRGSDGFSISPKGALVAAGAVAVGYLLLRKKSGGSPVTSSVTDLVLSHSGVKFKSGRYPWGSGARPHQHDDPYTFANGEWDYKALSDLSKQTSSSISSGKNVLENFGKMVNTSAPKRDYSRDLREMSDDEIRSFLNRVKLEKEYNQVMNELHPVEKSKGKKTVDNILKYGGPALAIAGSAVGIVGSLMDMKEKAQTKKFLAEDNKRITDWFESVYPIRDSMSLDEKLAALKNRQSLAATVSAYAKSLGNFGYK